MSGENDDHGKRLFHRKEDGGLLVTPDAWAENRLWLKQWDAPFSPDSDEALAWALTEGYSEAEWTQSGLRAKWQRQWDERQAAKQQEGTK